MNNTTNTIGTKKEIENKKEIETILNWVRFQRNGGNVMNSIKDGYYDYSKKEFVGLY